MAGWASTPWGVPELPATYEPLLKWTRALTAEQRARERQHEVDTHVFNFSALIPPVPVTREDHFPNRLRRGWWPLLPAEAASCCPWCALPSRDARLCSGCETLDNAFATPVDTLEFLTMADQTTDPENLIYAWKNGPSLHDRRLFAEHYATSLTSIAAPLSGYLEAHAPRLLAGDPVLTAVPSRVPAIANMMQIARDRGWFSREILISGIKAHDWAQLGADKLERQSRTERDWVVAAEAVVGRDVVVFDDVFVTGTSVFSYATALRRAGARSVRAVAVVRHVNPRVPHYFDAWRIARRASDVAWSPQRCRVANSPAWRGRGYPPVSRR